jgi:putative SOS response-associated peptidase YedK
MCSNYRPPNSEALAQYDIELPGFEFGECYPGSIGPLLASLKPDAWLPGTFGLLPHWAEPKLAKMTYNARSETVAEKPSFRTAWRHRQLAVIPVQAFFEPCYESGKAVRWRIEREDGKPFGLAGLWESRTTKDGDPAWSFTMLTINADEHPVMHRFHKPGDEKRSVVVLEDDAWMAWLKADREEGVRGFLQQFDPGRFCPIADPRPPAATKRSGV